MNNIKSRFMDMNSIGLPSIQRAAGANGRKSERSTEMGLYICKILCDKLGIAAKTCSKYEKEQKQA